MEILNTRSGGPNIWLILLGVAFIALSFFLLYRAIIYFRWKTNATAFILVFGFLLLLSLGVATVRNNVLQNETIYEVMVKDEESLREMKEKYVVLKQSGTIYIVKKKRSILGFDLDNDEEEMDVTGSYKNNSKRTDDSGE